VSKGELIRVGRGRYVLPPAEHSENLGLALVAAAVPRSVVCLLSALRFTASDGVSVRIYSPAKTVADCFKFRNKTGLDVAIEALREVLRTKRCTREELWAAGKACRVTTVIRPYLEAL
jgi:predicted transcriptional regulator of viral defense system